MESVLIKNVAYGNYYRWKLDTVSLKSQNKINLPNFFIIAEEKKNESYILLEKCHKELIDGCWDNCIHIVLCKLGDGMPRVTLIAYLSDQLNQIWFRTSGEVYSSTLARLAISDIKKLKLKYGEIFLNLHVASNSKFCSDFGDDDYCCEFTSTLAKSFTDNNINSNVTILSRNREFKVHKNILSSRSDYFAAILKHETSEKKNNQILIKNRNGDLLEDLVVQELVRYIYTNTVKNLNQVALDLFELAHMYNLMTLSEICLGHLKNNISIENIPALLKISTDFDDKDLKSKVSNFIKRQETFLVEAIFYISPSLWKTEPHEIESSVLKTTGKNGNIYEFKFRMKKETDDYCLYLDFLSQSVSSFFAKLSLKLCNSDQEQVGKSIDCINISPNKTVESFFLHKIFSQRDLEDYIFDNDKLFLSIFISHLSVMSEKSVNFIGGLTKNEPHECKILKDLSNLFNNPSFSDYKIKTLDKEFHVHKNILAARCPMFMSNSKNINLQSDEDCLFIDKESEIVEALLHYIYSGSKDKLSKFPLELHQLAKEYEFEKLRQDCIPYLD